ncbi:class I SAM-dependent methyltransferase [Patescibacteria group bacterium]|nr:class I SAM-dependent methyltransferase [Patescibacteria group bacterium]
MNKDCRFCKSNSLTLLFSSTKKAGAKRKYEDYACTSNSFGIHGPIVKCQNCQIIYVDDDSSQKEISTYYEQSTDPTYFSEQQARKITFEKYLAKLEKQYPQKGKLLDIGTNTGLFVKLALNHGWEAAGLEPNKWAVEYAKKNYNISLINKPFTDKMFKPESFDAITMWDVIEHFTDPVSEIKKVYSCLKPGGVFAFSTVDPQSFLAKIMGTKWSWYMEMHRVFFSRQAAQKYLEQAGFRKIVFTSHWRNLSLGYLATRLEAVNPALEKIAKRFVADAHLDRTIVPYYANDLFDCYAFK